MWKQLTVRPIRNFKYFRIIVYISTSFLLGIESQIWLLVCLPVVCLFVNLSGCLSVVFASQPTDWFAFVSFVCQRDVSLTILAALLRRLSSFYGIKNNFFTDSQLHRNNKSSYGECKTHLQLKTIADKWRLAFLTKIAVYLNIEH